MDGWDPRSADHTSIPARRPICHAQGDRTWRLWARPAARPPTNTTPTLSPPPHGGPPTASPAAQSSAKPARPGGGWEPAAHGPRSASWDVPPGVPERRRGRQRRPRASSSPSVEVPPGCATRLTRISTSPQPVRHPASRGGSPGLGVHLPEGRQPCSPEGRSHAHVRGSGHPARGRTREATRRGRLQDGKHPEAAWLPGEPDPPSPGRAGPRSGCFSLAAPWHPSPSSGHKGAGGPELSLCQGLSHGRAAAGAEGDGHGGGGGRRCT